MQDRGFGRALGEFATGAAVVTARGKGEDLVGIWRQRSSAKFHNIRSTYFI
jgi:hypothetical protein